MKKGFIQVLPLILLAAFAVSTLVIVNRVQQEQQLTDIRSRAAGGICQGITPPNCKVSGLLIGGCGGRSEGNCRAVGACGCSWVIPTPASFALPGKYGEAPVIPSVTQKTPANTPAPAIQVVCSYTGQCLNGRTCLAPGTTAFGPACGGAASTPAPAAPTATPSAPTTCYEECLAKGIDLPICRALPACPPQRSTGCTQEGQCNLNYNKVCHYDQFLKTFSLGETCPVVATSPQPIPSTSPSAAPTAEVTIIITGILKSVGSSNIIVDTTPILVDSSTRAVNDFALTDGIGKFVKVIAYKDDKGTIIATSIELLSPTPTPTASITALQSCLNECIKNGSQFFCFMGCYASQVGQTLVAPTAPPQPTSLASCGSGLSCGGNKLFGTGISYCQDINQKSVYCCPRGRTLNSTQDACVLPELTVTYTGGCIKEGDCINNKRCISRIGGAIGVDVRVVAPQGSVCGRYHLVMNYNTTPATGSCKETLDGEYLTFDACNRTLTNTLAQENQPTPTAVQKLADNIQCFLNSNDASDCKNCASNAWYLNTANQKWFCGSGGGTGGGGVCGGASNCSVTCNDGKFFSDSCPGNGSFSSCQQWQKQACVSRGGVSGGAQPAEGQTCSEPHGQKTATGLYCCYNKTSVNKCAYPIQNPTGDTLPVNTWCSYGYLGGCRRCPNGDTYTDEKGDTFCGSPSSSKKKNLSNGTSCVVSNAPSNLEHCQDCANGYYPSDAKTGETATCGPVGSTPSPQNPGGLPNDTDCWPYANQYGQPNPPLPQCYPNCINGFHYVKNAGKCGPEKPQAETTGQPTAGTTGTPAPGTTVQPTEGQTCSQSHGTQVGNLYCCNGKLVTQCLNNGDWCRSNTYPLTGLTHPYCDGACPGGISHWEELPNTFGVQAPKCGPAAATTAPSSGTGGGGTGVPSSGGLTYGDACRDPNWLRGILTLPTAIGGIINIDKPWCSGCPGGKYHSTFLYTSCDDKPTDQSATSMCSEECLATGKDRQICQTLPSCPASKRFGCTQDGQCNLNYNKVCHYDQFLKTFSLGEACSSKASGGGGGIGAAPPNSNQCQNGDQNRDQNMVLLCECANGCSLKTDNSPGGGGTGWVCDQNCKLVPANTTSAASCFQLDYVHQGTSNYCGVKDVSSCTKSTCQTGGGASSGSGQGTGATTSTGQPAFVPATPTPTPYVGGAGACNINPIRYPVPGAGWCDNARIRCSYQNGQVTQMPDPWCEIDGAVPANTCIGPDQRSAATIGCTVSQRTTPPSNSQLVNGGKGLTNGTAMNAGNFQVEGYCANKGTVSQDGTNWFCGSTPLTVRDYDTICQQTYNNNLGAFAIQNGGGSTPAFNWRCYSFGQ